MNKNILLIQCLGYKIKFVHCYMRANRKPLVFLDQFMTFAFKPRQDQSFDRFTKKILRLNYQQKY